jgi:hypothetical protein
MQYQCSTVRICVIYGDRLGLGSREASLANSIYYDCDDNSSVLRAIIGAHPTQRERERAQLASDGHSCQFFAKTLSLQESVRVSIEASLFCVLRAPSFETSIKIETTRHY